jgi:hypothetical protein
MRRSVGRWCCGGWSCGGLEHDLHRPRDLDLTLNAPPDRAPELCAHGQHRNAASVARFMDS